MISIAERRLTAVDPDEVEFEMVIRVLAPTRRADDWECVMSITRLFEPPRAIFGVDSWQALMLAIRLVEQLLSDFVGCGGRLRYHGTNDAIDVPALMGQLSAD